jgi:hypothetical protein
MDWRLRGSHAPSGCVNSQRHPIHSARKRAAVAGAYGARSAGLGNARQLDFPNFSGNPDTHFLLGARCALRRLRMTRLMRAEPAVWLILLSRCRRFKYCVASPGYDDEFTNIELIERLGGGVLGYVQGNDVHPPGSYLLDWLLFAALRDWQLVRLAVALFTAGAIVYAVEWLRHRHGMRAATLALVLLALNPALLMWCTGLRWYAWFVPMLLWLLCPPPVSPGGTGSSVSLAAGTGIPGYAAFSLWRCLC